MDPDDWATHRAPAAFHLSSSTTTRLDNAANVLKIGTLLDAVVSRLHCSPSQPLRHIRFQNVL